MRIVYDLLYFILRAIRGLIKMAFEQLTGAKK